MSRLVAFEGADAFRRKEVAHRRVDALIRPLDIVAALFEEGGQRCHRRAADANQMHLHSTAASSMINRLDSPATSRALTPSGSVIAGPST